MVPAGSANCDRNIQNKRFNIMNQMRKVESDQAVYQTFDLLRFPLILLVIYIHNTGSSVSFGDGAVVTQHELMLKMLAENFISQGVARIAVPLFFLMSGYLFFFRSDFNAQTYKRKLASRAKTLAIPFLFWNIVWLIFKFALQTIPASARFFNAKNEPISHYSLFEFVDSIFGFTHDPNAYQFWFIRDLIVTVILSPILYVLLKRVGIVTLLVLAVFWFTGSWPLFIPGIEPVLFFSVGGFLALRSLDPCPKAGKAFLLLSGSAALVLFLISAIRFPQAHGNPFERSGILVGVAWMLCAARALPASMRLAGWLRNLSASAFFVFATHEPILTIARKIVYRFVPMGQWASVATYLLLPIMIAAITVCAYHICLKLFPRGTKIVTGGRS